MARSKEGAYRGYVTDEPRSQAPQIADFTMGTNRAVF
jgi:hypothetical protein